MEDGSEEQTAVQKLKELLSTDTVLAHFHPTLLIGISCDASEVGLGVVHEERLHSGVQVSAQNMSLTTSTVDHLPLTLCGVPGLN